MAVGAEGEMADVLSVRNSERGIERRCAEGDGVDGGVERREEGAEAQRVDAEEGGEGGSIQE